jgi:AbrB family looped-hinge helix DNA binding protein
VGVGSVRVLPIIRGDRIRILDDDNLEELGLRPLSDFPTLEMPPGIDVAMAIDVDVASITIDQQQLDRWELTIDQVAAAALANLRRVVGTWHGRVNEEEFDGIPVRTLKGWPSWATSLLLNRMSSLGSSAPGTSSSSHPTHATWSHCLPMSTGMSPPTSWTSSDTSTTVAASGIAGVCPARRRVVDGGAARLSRFAGRRIRRYLARLALHLASGPDLVLFLPVRRRIGMRITSKGQVTIPQAIREQVGLLPETEVEFVVDGDGVRIVKAPAARRPTRGARAVELLRRGAGRVTMTTDEIMALTRGEG